MWSNAAINSQPSVSFELPDSRSQLFPVDSQADCSAQVLLGESISSFVGLEIDPKELRSGSDVVFGE
jgi:hypothetical protein